MYIPDCQNSMKKSSVTVGPLPQRDYNFFGTTQSAVQWNLEGTAKMYEEDTQPCRYSSQRDGGG